MLSQTEHNLYQQDTELDILQILIPHLHCRSFIDIGAEKGSFTLFLHEQGLRGVLFEPLPQFASTLSELAAKTQCTFLPYAVDDTDRTSHFYIASDHDNNPTAHFSSLHKLNQDQRINQEEAITVNCRSLDSLVQEGQIKSSMGLVKIDTEGNDLNVLKGMSLINPEILMCEYFMPGIYAGWEQGHPQGLIEEAKRFGFEHCISIKRIDEYELPSIDHMEFIDTQWGNLIFVKEAIFQAAKPAVERLIAKKEAVLFDAIVKQSQLLRNEIKLLRGVCQERLEIIEALNRDKNENAAITIIKKLTNKANKWYKKISV